MIWKRMDITSIIPGLLLLSLAWIVDARHLIYEDSSTSLQPIVSQSRRTRICAELCMSGLGGTPCGNDCYDLIPTNLPLSGEEQDNQNKNVNSGGSRKFNATTRQSSCDVLCKNGLGYPLCNCDYDAANRYDTDFVQICSAFCVNYDYQIYGCQNCTLYQNFVNNQNTDPFSDFDTASIVVNGGAGSLTIGWDSWCKQMCSDGNGGAACNCDLLP